MREYLYSDLKSIEFIEIDYHQININGITIFDIDQLHLQEMDEEFVLIRFLIQDKEVANITIDQNEKLIMDENNNFFIVPIEGIEF